MNSAENTDSDSQYIADTVTLREITTRMNKTIKYTRGQPLGHMEIDKKGIDFVRNSIPFLLETLQNAGTLLRIAASDMNDPLLVNISNIVLPSVIIMNADLDFYASESKKGMQDVSKHFKALEAISDAVRTTIDHIVPDKLDRDAMFVSVLPDKTSKIILTSN